jgi:catechol 2,3-dioxygenase-like lactoylglutathione lyase family enzyme
MGGSRAPDDPNVRRVVVDHLAIRVRDFAASRRFYEVALAPLGIDLLHSNETQAGFGIKGREQSADDFWVLAGGVPTTGVHVAFAAPNREAVVAFYAAALGAGGHDNGAPGLRPEYHPGYYAAFVFDPHGNNVEAVFHGGAVPPGTLA